MLFERALLLGFLPKFPYNSQFCRKNGVISRAGFYTGIKARMLGIKSRAGFYTSIKTRAGFYTGIKTRVLMTLGEHQSKHPHNLLENIVSTAIDE